jgi:hypothetical protein
VKYPGWNVFCPAELFRHPDVELALQRITALAENNQVLGPTDFSNQWLEFCVTMICGIELAHIPEVLGRKPQDARELGSQIGSQALHDRFAPTGSATLTLADDPPDVPVKCHQFLIDRPKSLVLCGADALLYFDKQGRVIVRNHVLAFAHTPPSLKLA